MEPGGRDWKQLKGPENTWLNNVFVGWRDGSAVKNTDCSSRGPEFNSQQPHSGIWCPFLVCLKRAIVCSHI